MRAAAGEAAQLKEAAAGGHKEHVPIEQSGVKGLRHEEGIGVHIAIDEGEGNAVRVEHAAARPRVVDQHLRLAGDIAVDDEIVRRRPRRTEEGIDRERGVAGGGELQILVPEHIGDGEHLVHVAVDRRDQPPVLEPLQIDEGGLHAVHLKCMHRAA